MWYRAVGAVLSQTLPPVPVRNFLAPRRPRYPASARPGGTVGPGLRNHRGKPAWFWPVCLPRFPLAFGAPSCRIGDCSLGNRPDSGLQTSDIVHMRMDICTPKRVVDSKKKKTQKVTEKKNALQGGAPTLGNLAKTRCMFALSRFSPFIFPFAF